MRTLDVAIVGSGPVGATLAAMAHASGLEVGLFEARTAPSGDRRTLALSHASRERLEEAGAWPREAATAIASIHISQRGGPGRTLLEAHEQRLPALGYTVAYAALEAALHRRVAALGVPLEYGAACTGIRLEPDAAHVQFSTGGEASAKLLVLADGGANANRIPGVAFLEKDYLQRAVVALVTCDRAHAGRAYERFTPQGPMALLPVEDRYALVWTAKPTEAERLLALDDASFLVELQQAFGDRAGRFLAADPRASFPLKLRAINTPVALRTAMVGNAAQALHPVAGQGLNLGLRDAATLAAALARARRDDVGGAAMLREYAEARRRDATRGIAFTDFLVSSFADARRLPTWGRGLGLIALDLFPPARRLLGQRMIHGAPAP